MNVVLAVLGIACIGFVIVDALWTTLWVDGSAGPLTKRVSRWVWRLVFRLVPHDRHHLLSLSGPLVLIATFLIWIMLLWLGWLALFSTDPRAILGTHSESPPDFLGRVYFVGYSLFTLGNGDLSPQGWWGIATVLVTATGMILVTLAVSYLLSVISAVTAMRTLASQITAIGERPEAFVLTEWDGSSFPTLSTHLTSIATTLRTVTDQHLSYPVLHYFHAGSVSEATPVGIAILDEALTLLQHGLREDVRPPHSVIRPTRVAVSRYLDTLISAKIPPADDVPPSPDLHMLRTQGVPVVDDGAFASSVRVLEERRRRLLAMVNEDNYEWPT